MITESEIIRLKQLVYERDIEHSRTSLLKFTQTTFEKFNATLYHQAYYRILDIWAKGLIRNLIISCPPQHGKSEGATRRLPAYCFGRNPDEKIAIGCYNTPFAQKFNRDIQRIIDSKEYGEIFPNTKISGVNVETGRTNYIRNSNEFEIVNYTGSLKAVGRGGGITGNPVDKFIIDDLYKDSAEGNSPVIRESVWEWYTGAVTTRFHNNSQQLISFTRWHEEDLIGKIEKTEKVITAKTWDDLLNAGETWVKVNFEAIKTGDPTELDPRKVGEPLYSEKHSLKKLNKARAADPVKFDSLYQGDPISKDGLLYGDSWKTYFKPPEGVIVRKNYTDSADTGDNYLCSIDYDLTANGLIYVYDVLYTQAPMEVTEPLLSQNLLKNKVAYSDIESNNGGRGFARKIHELTAGAVVINWFSQSDNKESRVITNAATVMQKIVFPDDWHIRWPLFYNHVTRFKRKFKANKHDDAPDVLTGIIEKCEIIPNRSPFMSADEL